ncbi:aflatoxin regulatory protein-domain-containing protein [Aspergillus nidulans var. acristatus]
MMTEPFPSSSVCSLSSSRRLPNGQQPRKLRDSCIHCANSKVKCNKEKPICGRCVRRRLPCEYKVSRRTGRTSRSIAQLLGSGSTGRTTETLTISPAIHPANTGGNATSSVLPSNPVTSGPSQTPLLTPITPIPTSEPSPEHCIPQTPDVWRSFLSPSAFNPDVGDLSSLISMPPDVGNLFGSVMGSPLFDACDIDSIPAQAIGESVSVTEHPLLPTPALSDPKSEDTLETTSNHVKPCLISVLDVFRDVFADTPTPCKKADRQQGSSRALTIESMVSDNREAIDTLSAVMDCPCSHDAYILSIVSLAVLKVMGRYIAAARGQIPATEDTRGWGQEVSMHSDRPRQFLPFDEQLPGSPGPVGSYSIEGRNQNRMAAQLVLSELHRVQRLVNILASRLESLRLRPCLSPASTFGSNSTDSIIENPLLAARRILPLSGSTFSRMEDDLRKRLRAVSSETIEILRRA